MQPSDLQRFNYAVSLAQSGQKIEANNLLRELSRAYPNDTNVWLWLAFTSSDGAAARFALDRAAQTDPANPALAGARQWVQQEFPAPPVAANPTFTPATYGMSSYGSAPMPGGQVLQAQSAYNQPPLQASLRTADLLADDHKARRGWKVIVPVLTVIGFLLFLGLRIFWRMDVNPFEDTTVPPYGSSAVIKFSDEKVEEFKRGMVENAREGYTIKDVQLRTYLSNTGEQTRILNFYSKEMPDKGWRYLKQFKDGDNVALYYGKGKDNAALIMVYKIDRGSYYTLGIPEPYKPGDIVIFVFNFKMEA
jgi:hypothetical protein